MRRRAFLYGTVAILAASPEAEAQQAGKLHQVGVFTGSAYMEASRQGVLTGSANVEALRQGLRDLGYREGTDVVILLQDVEGRFDRLDAAVAQLIRRGVDVIVAGGSESVQAARRATASIPIVMTSVGDPVRQGFITSFAKPGGNITGLSNVVSDLAPKWLELLRSVAPGLKRVAVLWNPPQPAHEGLLKELERGAVSLGLDLQPLAVRTDDDLDGAFATAKRERVGALTMLGSVVHFRNLRRIADFASQFKLPAVSWTREFVDLGGLMSYGVNQVAQYRRAAYFVDKLLKGAAPATLPVEQPTNFELIINLKTAKALGLTIPPSLLARADQVIE
jgi:putative ABC transport system substrate-binding protein